MATSFNTTLVTNILTTTTTQYKSPNQLKFQPVNSVKIPLYMKKERVVADFNGDNRMDLAFLNEGKDIVSLYFGNGNGTFRTEFMSYGFYNDLIQIIAGDFNNDNRVDLIGFREFGGLTVKLGDGFGRFQHSFYQPTSSGTTEVISVDLNGDPCLDIVWTTATAFCDRNNFVNIFSGSCDGKFSKYERYSTGINSYPLSIAVTDFNNDNYPDIAVLNQYDKNIGIFLGYGNGTFQEQKTSISGGLHTPESFAIGDFNNDKLSDVVISYEERNYIIVMFGYGNGTLGKNKKYDIGDISNYKLFVKDFNNDGFLDIGFGRTSHQVNILIGDGNGNFQLQIAFLTRITNGNGWIAIGDFNTDGREDIIDVNESSGFYEIFLNIIE
ncbi:hypothetical protein I4U23_005330 [Adineta vaga]|nr:hypothetical protein I4U23_005330 [Adineta vaga]